MSDVRDLGQRYIAALWEAASTLGTDSTATEKLAGMVAAVSEAEAQLVGLRLHLLHEACLVGADDVVSDVRQSVRTTASQATASLKLAADLAERFPLIAAALNHGTISLSQADAIVTGLRKLPGRLTRSDLAQCQESILAHVDTLGPSELRTLASRLLEIIDPEHAEADEAKRLAAEERSAHRDRFVRLAPDFHGSVRITGQLPLADAALLSAQLEALMPTAASYSQAGEAPPTPEARRADALVLLAQAASSSGELPAHGCDRPQVHVTLDLDTLVSGIGSAGLLGLDAAEGLSAGEARRIACDAGLIPMVLGNSSSPMDVGRLHRLFTPSIRAALVQRDQGCAFPGCTVSPASCEAHHIVPWWAGGPSSLANGVLLCPHHHRLVEPDPLQSASSQWDVVLDPATGLPRFVPPLHVDPDRRPRQHTRYLLQQVKLPSVAPPRPFPMTRLDELISQSAANWAQAG